MTEREKARVIQLWKNGLSLTAIRQMLTIKEVEFKRTIAEMKRNGEFPTTRTRKKDLIFEAIKNGEINPYVLAETYGVTLKTAQRYRYEYGSYPKGRPKLNYRHSPRTEAIFSDIQGGNMTVAEISRKYSVSLSYVKKLRLKLRNFRNEGINKKNEYS